MADLDLDAIATEDVRQVGMAQLGAQTVPLLAVLLTPDERDALVASVRAAIDVRNDPDGSLAVWDALDEALAPFGDDR